MEPEFKSSFIPKKPIATKIDTGYATKKRSGIGFFTLITVVLFLASVLITAGVYAYKLSVQGQISRQISDLEKARDEFEPKFISEATRLNNRIIAAQEILKNHVAPSTLFTMLERLTLKSVQFTTFTFTDNPDGTIEISATGIADSFRSIVLQSDRFGAEGSMKNVIFTDLQPNETGDVTFAWSANLDPSAVLFSGTLNPTSVPAVESVDDEEESVDEEIIEFGDPDAEFEDLETEIDAAFDDLEEISDTEQ